MSEPKHHPNCARISASGKFIFPDTACNCKEVALREKLDTAEQQVVTLKEERDAMQHRAESAESDWQVCAQQVATLRAQLERWVRQFNGQTEPVPAIYWTVELNESKKLLALLTDGK